MGYKHEDGYRVLCVKDGWISLNERDDETGMFYHRIKWWYDLNNDDDPENDVEPYYVCFVDPNAPGVYYLDYFVGYGGPYSVELAWGAYTDGYSRWNIYRSPHPTGPFTVFPGVKVNDYPIEQGGPPYQEFRYNDRSMDYSDHFYYMIEDVQEGELYWYKPPPGWQYPPPPWTPYELPPPPPRLPAPWGLTATDRPKDNGHAIELRWNQYYAKESFHNDPYPAYVERQMILRNEEPYGDFKILGYVEPGVYYYLDDGVPCNGKTYYYVVRREKFCDYYYLDSEDSNMAEGVAIDNNPGDNIEYITPTDDIASLIGDNRVTSIHNYSSSSLDDSYGVELSGFSCGNIISADIYPQPAGDILKYRVGLDEYDNVEVELFDISGRRLRKSSFNSSYVEDEFDVSELSTGIYILKIRTGKDMISKKVVIIDE